MVTHVKSVRAARVCGVVSVGGSEARHTRWIAPSRDQEHDRWRDDDGCLAEQGVGW